MCCCEASVLSGKSGDRVDFVSLIWYRKTMTKSGLLVKFRFMLQYQGFSCQVSGLQHISSRRTSSHTAYNSLLPDKSVPGGALAPDTYEI